MVRKEVVACLCKLLGAPHQGHAAGRHLAPESAARPTVARTSALLQLLHSSHAVSVGAAAAQLHALIAAAWGAQDAGPLHPAAYFAGPHEPNALRWHAPLAAPASQHAAL